jgi:hypothetical protein
MGHGLYYLDATTMTNTSVDVGRDFMEQQYVAALQVLEQFSGPLGYACSGRLCGKATLPVPPRFPCCGKRMCRSCLWDCVTNDPRYSPDLPCCSSDPAKVQAWHRHVKEYADFDSRTGDDGTEAVRRAESSATVEVPELESGTGTQRFLSVLELAEYCQQHRDDLDGRTTEDLRTLISHDLEAAAFNPKQHGALSRALKRANLHTERVGRNAYRIYKIEPPQPKRRRRS